MGAQMQALEQILCFGNAIVANYTDYDQCEFDTCAECPYMNITYREPPAEIECAEALTQKPCDQDFLDTEYGTWKNESSDLLAACKVCPSGGGSSGGGSSGGGNGCSNDPVCVGVLGITYATGCEAENAGFRRGDLTDGACD